VSLSYSPDSLLAQFTTTTNYQIKLQVGPNIIDQLHTDMESLIAGVVRNDELRTAKASVLVVIREFLAQYLANLAML
jgi:hypothetical protein